MKSLKLYPLLNGSARNVMSPECARIGKLAQVLAPMNRRQIKIQV